MEHGFNFRWISMGFGAVIVGKIIAAALSQYLHFSM
jgi:hypothetical protein